MVESRKYDLSFSAFSLSSEAFSSVIENSNNLTELADGIEDVPYSVIPVNSEESQKRYLREILKRIKNVHPSILEIYSKSNSNGKRVIEFFSVCKSYSIVAEFMLEVVRNKWRNLDFELGKYDFKSFLQNKLAHTDTVDQVSPRTIDELSWVVLKMMKEVGMYNGENFQKIEWNSQVLSAISKSGNQWFLDALLLTDEEKRELNQW